MSKRYLGGRNLSGPNIWTEFEFTDDEGNKNWIHLFGEKHTVDAKELCISDSIDFVDFIEYLFGQAYKYKIYTNFFLELPYRLNAKNIKQYNYLSQIYNRFQSCFSPKKKCKYNPYVQMNTTDIRSAYKFEDEKFIGDLSTTVNQMIKNYILKLLQMFVQLKFNNNSTLQKKIFKTMSFIQLLVDLYLPHSLEIFRILLKNPDYEKDISKIIEPILSEFSPDMYLKKDFEELKNTLDRLYSFNKVREKKKVFILKHQLDQLRKDKIMFKRINIADWIYYFLLQTNKKYQEDQLPIFMNAWSKLYLQILKSDLTKKKEIDGIISLFQEFQQELSSPLTFMDSTLLDGYMMARIFRRYGGSPRESSVLTLVYEGMHHVEIQSIFFSQVLGLTPLNVVRSDMDKHPRCLNIDLDESFNILQYGENIELINMKNN
jgi:hypothetical protein